MANVIQDFNISAEAYNGLGAVCERKGKFEDALEYYSTSRKFAEENYDLLNLAKAHNAFGRIYNQQRNYSKAVEHKQTSIALFERIKDLPEMAKGYTSLALTFYDMGNMEKNIEFNFKKLEERFMISLNYMNFGVIFKNKNEWNKSKYYFKTAIEFMENLKIPYHLADCYQQFADMYKRKGESPKATYYLEKAREIYISLSADSYIKQIDDELKSFGSNSIC
jgi:tetratricopeptide (TPR) repeat protein